jgi:uncharacterized protein (DUF433 family)
MTRECVEKRGSAWYVAQTRVSMASVVHHFLQGASPETILQKFPALGSLGSVYGAIAFYLDNDNREMIDASLAHQQQGWTELEKSADAPPHSFTEGFTPARPAT